MKACVCDMCGKIVKYPYSGHFREYYIGTEISDAGMLLPIKSKRKVKIDLCENCWQSLIDIARDRRYKEKEKE